MFCDIVTPDDQPFEGDPRAVLRRNLQRAAGKGFTYYVAPELEYFYFEDQKAVAYGIGICGQGTKLIRVLQLFSSFIL